MFTFLYLLSSQKEGKAFLGSRAIIELGSYLKNKYKDHVWECMLCLDFVIMVCIINFSIKINVVFWRRTVVFIFPGFLLFEKMYFNFLFSKNLMSSLTSLYNKMMPSHDVRHLLLFYPCFLFPEKSKHFVTRILAYYFVVFHLHISG